ncbi:MAG: hypothetical protein HN738_00230 [Gammaproteobacteria bacterium]|nr:hypothetical protein [Gammaproteobacteria bacterium]
MNIRFSRGSLNPTLTILIGALVALCLSSYPIIFLGKSHFSPGYNVSMVYSGFPYVPGYQSLETERLSADRGAGPWQNLPYSRIQYKSIFVDGEFPFWNRYNSAGLPLFGQGQSQILDPLHWIAVASKGNSWGWDVKFLLSKLLFLIGLGFALYLITQNRIITSILVLSAAFIGFNYFRFNHPAFFNLTYAPWVFFFYLQLVKNLQRDSVNSGANFRRWADWPTVGIVLASALVLFSGTPKEAVILLLALHISGLLGILGVGKTLRHKTFHLGFLIVLWIVIAFVTAPHWLIFLDTLYKVSSISGEARCSFIDSPLQFMDTFFAGSSDTHWSWPTVNIFISATALSALVVLPRLWRESGFRMALMPLIGLLCFANGVVPDYLCEKIPFIGNIHHIWDVCFAAAIVFAVVLAGYGLRALFDDLRSGKSRTKWFGYIFIFSLVMLWWVRETYDGYALFSAPALLTMFAIGGTIGWMLLVVWSYKAGEGFSKISAFALGCVFVLPHSYHGLHLKTGWDELDNLIINPTPRADLLVRSQTLESLGYLLPVNHAQHKSNLVDEVLAWARLNGGEPELIQQHESDFAKAVRGATEAVLIQQHTAEFFRKVGVTRWLDRPSRVLGVRHSPMPGFYAHVDLESLAGPDALTEPRFRELLELMGWHHELEKGWARTMSARELINLESLLDILNVGYVVSWKKDINTSHYASDFSLYSEIMEVNALADQASTDELGLHRVREVQDRVSCTPRGLGADGKSDNVFVVDMIRPAYGADSKRKVRALRLERKNPKRVYHTGGANWVLGVSAGQNLPLLNSENGQVRIPAEPGYDQLWLYICADGEDKLNSEYRARAAYQLKEPLPRILDLDMMAWERKSAWPRAFFVDQVASYQTKEELAGFFHRAMGVPLVAVSSEELAPPTADRTVVPAFGYRMTENSTSFSIHAPSAGFVALTEVNIPGDVHVTVNGQNAEVITVNHVFRGLKLPKAGIYEISFYYMPRFWFLSLALSLIGIISVFASLILFKRPRLGMQ